MQDKVLVRKYDSMGRELLRIFYDGTQQLTMIDRRETSRGLALLTQRTGAKASYLIVGM